MVYQNIGAYTLISTNSVAILNTTKLEPKGNNSTVFCLLEYQIIRVLLTNINIPEFDSLFKILQEWFTST